MKFRNPRNDRKRVGEAVELLFKILDCDFLNLTDKYLAPIFWKVPYFNWNLVMRKTVNQNKVDYFNASLNRFVCQRSKNHLIKSIRFGVQDFVLLKEKLSTGNIFINLVLLKNIGHQFIEQIMKMCKSMLCCTV
jgi:hypothetical protein